MNRTRKSVEDFANRLGLGVYMHTPENRIHYQFYLEEGRPFGKYTFIGAKEAYTFLQGIRVGLAVGRSDSKDWKISF